MRYEEEVERRKKLYFNEEARKKFVGYQTISPDENLYKYFKKIIRPETEEDDVEKKKQQK